MPHAAINGQRISFEDSGGSGPAVLLMHGYLMDGEMFAPQVAALAPAYRVVTFDERGFGRTAYDGKPFSYWDSARDALALLDHLGIARAVVGGMSQGGFIALRAALLAPERVRALLLFDTQSAREDLAHMPGYWSMCAGWAQNGIDDEAANRIARMILGDPEIAAPWTAKWRAMPKEGIVEPTRTLLERDDITDRLGAIACPALVVHGTADRAIPLAKGERLAASLSGARAVVAIEGAGHAANYTHPELVNPPVLAFLQAL